MGFVPVDKSVKETLFDDCIHTWGKHPLSVIVDVEMKKNEK